MEDLRSLLYRLKEQHTLTKEEWTALIAGRTPKLARELFSLARQEQQRWYGHDIYIRGLIEFTNYCRNDCLYCGIRRSNKNAARYRLSQEEILSCCRAGYDLETDPGMAEPVRRIRKSGFPASYHRMRKSVAARVYSDSCGRRVLWTVRQQASAACG